MHGTVTDYRVYVDGINIEGVTAVSLPNRENMTVSLKGAGIAGEVNMPLKGKFGSMECSITLANPNFNTLLTRAGYINLSFRTNLQKPDKITGIMMDVGLKVDCRCLFKNKSGGKLEIGSTIDEEYTFEIISMGEYENGIEKFYVDKLNGIYREMGVPMNLTERANLGLL